MTESVPKWRSLVALGDSFTEGLHDELGPDGRHRGWADRVAAELAVRTGGLRYANLAVRGRLLGQVVAEQVPLAGRLAPDLITFHAGANDVLRPRVDLPSVLASYDAAVATVRKAADDVVLFTVIERAGGTGRTADRLAHRFALFNATVRQVATRHGCRVADLAAVPALQDRRLWHEDRLHLSPEGHARVAAIVLDVLGVPDGGPPGWWREPLDVAAAVSRAASLRADVRWVRRHFLPWAGRRLRGTSSGDTIAPKRPELVDVIPD